MADTKVSGLTEDTTPASGDYVATVDVSDTTMAVTGTDKKVTLSNLGALVLAGTAAKATILATARTFRTNLASTSTASFDGSANVTPGVTGTLVVGNGGTGAATLTGLVKGNGTAAMTAVTAPSGTVVGDTDAQTLTNKTIDATSNTVSNVSSLRVARQNNTTNSTVNANRIETGWGFVTGTGARSASKTVTFGAAFSTTPVVTISPIGFKSGSDPTSITDCSAAGGDVYALANTPSTTGFTACIGQADNSAISTAIRLSFTWIAIGA